jgi:hypothetical protein
MYIYIHDKIPYLQPFLCENLNFYLMVSDLIIIYITLPLGI